MIILIIAAIFSYVSALLFFQQPNVLYLYLILIFLIGEWFKFAERQVNITWED